ncbi:MAG: hypothetical protein P9L99_17520 [Candidatus Lernaella stagnicola]|nr:hypothetical protein [Candidatus Lernaella stagnicola]
MKFHKTVGLGALLLVVVIAVAACTPPRPDVDADQPEKAAPEPFNAPFVEYLLFGYWEGEPFLSDWVETRQLPREEGLRFGWRIKLKEPHTRYVTIVERMTAPTPLSDWGRLDQRHLVDQDRRVATIPNTLKVRDGWIHRANWVVSPDDPLGLYRVEIQVNGRMAARVYFDLMAPDQIAPGVEDDEEVDEEIPDEPDDL